MPKSLKIIGTVIVGFSLMLILLSSTNDSPTNDEVAHIGAGYSYLIKHNMRLNAEHPPLVKDLAALPLLFIKTNRDIFTAPVYWLGDIAAESQWGFGHILLFKAGNNADQILHLVRLPVLIFFILAAWLIFKWAGDLFGSRTSVISLILFCFSPTVLAHAGLVTTDMGATATILFSIYFFIRYLQDQTRNNLIFASLAFGIAASTKFSTLLLLPFFVVLALIYRKITQSHPSKSPARLFLDVIIIAVTGFIVIVTPLYYLNIYNYPLGQQAKDAQIITTALYGDNSLTKPLVWLSGKPLLNIYGNYLLGMSIITQRVSSVGDIYFLGEFRKSAGPSYFPIIYLIKEPLPWLILLGLGVALALRKRNWENAIVSKFLSWARSNFTEFSMLLWIVMYWAVTLESNLKIGVRHLLPVYPFVIMLVSGQISRLTESQSGSKFNTLLKIITPVLLAWYIVDAFVAFPGYISYYNETVGGGTNGYQYAVDSNLDWGQDAKRLGQWATANNIPKIEVDYFGWADPGYYLGNKFIPINSDRYKGAKDFQARNQSGGWIAVSATTLFQRSYGAYAWLRPFAPTVTIGNSIYIWKF